MYEICVTVPAKTGQFCFKLLEICYGAILFKEFYVCLDLECTHQKFT